MVHKLLQQFIEDVHWGELDYLIVDLPPGTGDAQLSLSQLLPITGAVMVTTPQEVSVIDVEKALSMWTRVEVPVLGLVENMSGFVCPSCGHHEEISLRGGVSKLAERAGLKFLGEIQLEPSISRAGDEGTPAVIRDPKSKVAENVRPHRLRHRLPALGEEQPDARERQAQLEADPDSLIAPLRARPPGASRGWWSCRRRAGRRRCFPSTRGSLPAEGRRCATGRRRWRQRLGGC